MKGLLSVVLIVITLVLGVISCMPTPIPTTTPTPSPTGGTGPMVPVVPNDSIVTAQILSVTAAAVPFPWQAELRLLDSQDVTGYVNLTKEKIGQNLLVKTKEDMAGYGIGDAITGNLRVAGDERGTFFILSNVPRK